MKFIQIDHLDAEPEPEVALPVEVESAVESRFTSPELEETPEDIPNLRRFFKLAENEYPSPAFAKRDRLSYGALYEGVDIFEEDGGVRNRGRKRARFGRNSGAWRYTSQSPSSEPLSPEQDAMEEDTPEEASPKSAPQVPMMHEGCQTVEIETTQAAPVPIEAHNSKPRQQATPSPIDEDSTMKTQSAIDTVPTDHDPALQEGLTRSPHAVQEANDSITESQEEQSTQRPVDQQPVEGQTQLHLSYAPQITTPHQDAPSETSPSALFGSVKPQVRAYSMFGTSAPTRVEATSSIADQVRFGFSHTPAADPSAAVPQHSHHFVNSHDAYPISYLDPHAPTNYPDMAPYLDAAGPQETTGHDQGLVAQPPPIQSFGHGQWEVSTQAPFYNQIEGGHFGADALDEGSRIVNEQSSLHTTDIARDTIPQGFAAYGSINVPEQHQDSDSRTSSFAHNPQKMNPDGVEIVELDDYDAEDDGEQDEHDLSGEPTEEGDYDQRNYDDVSDNEEGLSEQEDEIEQEMIERYGDGEVFDEDGEPWNEDEEGYEGEEGYEDEEEYDESEEEDDDDETKPSYPPPTYRKHQSAYQSQPPLPRPPAPREPVVISLLSDSEDEEPVPASAPANESAPTPQKEPTTIETTLNQIETQSLTEPEGDATAPPTNPQDAEVAAESSDLEITTKNIDGAKGDLGNTDVVDFASQADKDASEQARALEIDSASDKDFLSSAVEEESEVSEYDSAHGEDDLSQGEPGDAESEKADDDSSDVINITEEDPSVDGEGDAERVKVAEDNEAEQAIEVGNESSTTGVQDVGDDLADNQNKPAAEELVADSVKEEAQHAAPRANLDPAPEVDDSSGYMTDDKNSSFTSQVEIPEEMDVEEEESDLVATQLSAAETQVPADVVTEDKPISFANQVEIDQHMDEISEDDVMIDQDTPVEHQEERIAAEQTWETEDIEIIDVEDENDDDVAMLDAAPSEWNAMVDEDDDDVDMLQSRQSESRGESEVAASSPVAIELISEVIVTEEVTKVDFSVGEPLEKSDESPTQLEEPGQTAGVPVEQPMEASHRKKERGPANPFPPPLTISFASRRVEHEISTTFSFGEPKAISKEQQPLIPMQSQLVGEIDLQDQEDVTDESFQEALEQQDDILIDTHEVKTKKEADGPIEQASDAEEGSDKEGDMPQSSALSPPPAELEEDEVASIDELTQERKEPLVSQVDEVEGNERAVDEGSSLDGQTSETQVEAGTPRQATKPLENIEDQATTSALSTQAQQSPEPEKESTPCPEADHSVNLARQAAQATRRSKNAPAAEPTRTSPRFARGRSNSLLTQATDDGDSSFSLAKGALATQSKDTSVNLAKAALDSPSKSTTNPSPQASSSAATLKNDLIKQLRTGLPECVNLKSLRYHNEKFPNIVAVVVTDPSPPARAKGGPREYSMTFHVTDPSIAPRDVVEVQLYRPHKDHLPIVKVGDAILLQRPQVKALSKKGHGLRSGVETAWVVYDEDEGPPQIKGLPVEDWEEYREYMTGLRQWWRAMDEGINKKVKEKGKKMKEM